MTSREQLSQAIAAIGADYGPRPLRPEHVERWISQFPTDVQAPILDELLYVLKRTYIPEGHFDTFFRNVITYKGLGDPTAYWRGVRFLKLQEAGNSQKDLLAKFDRILRETCGLSVDECGHPATRFAYVDDALFSGGRIKSDLIKWIHSDAPPNAQVDVLVMLRHTQGSFFAEADIAKAAESTKKHIAIRFPHSHILEDRKARTNVSDVLRPTSIPSDRGVLNYVSSLRADLKLRAPGSVGGAGFFSSETGRSLLEQEFLKAGVLVREVCPLLKPHLRPLGCTVQHMLGFGSTIVTYRNCPNNAPLALWAGHPWVPLFPRETN